MGLLSQADGLRGATAGPRRRHEGRDFLLVMSSLERRLEDLRTNGAGKAAAEAAAPAVPRRPAEAYYVSRDEALTQFERSRIASQAPENGTLWSARREPPSEEEADDSHNDPLRTRLRQLCTLSFEEKLCLSREGVVVESPTNACAGSGLRRRASCPDPHFLIEEASTPTAVSTTMDVKAEAERAELRFKLSKAESDLERLSRSAEIMRRDHETQLSGLRTQSSAQAQRHARECESLRSEAAAVVSENLRLQRALTDEKRHSAELIRRSAQEAHRSSVPSTPLAVAPIIARLEVEALRHADLETRAKLKKKLQLKWHPDKCINAALAKCVMQELQQRPEW